MKRLKLGLFFAAVCAFCLTATDTHALDATNYTPPPDLKDSPVIITGYSLTDSQLDYVQLYNEENLPINLDSWRLEYLVEGQTEPVLSVPLSGWMAPTNYVLAADQLAVTNPDFAFILANQAGEVSGELRIVPAENSGFVSHSVVGKNLKTGVNQREKTSSGSYSKATTTAFKTFGEDDVAPDLYGGGFYDFLIATKLQFSEIVANPKKCSPLATELDCADYIKVYNPTSLPIDLSQFRLRVGYLGQNPSSSNTFILHGMLQPGQYAIVTHDFDGGPVSMTNSGGFAWLEDTYGIMRYDNTVVEYPDASADSKKGWAWAYDAHDGQWKWTSRPTPRDAPSVFVLPPEKEKKSSARRLVPCRPDQYRNPETNRCRTKASASSLKPCDPGETRNPATNRCRSVKGVSSELKPCDPGQERNSATNRCRKKSSEIHEAAFAVQKVSDSPSTFAGWWVLGGVAAVAAGYGMWEWRRELWGGMRKIGTFFTSGK